MDRRSSLVVDIFCCWLCRNVISVSGDLGHKHKTTLEQ